MGVCVGVFPLLKGKVCIYPTILFLNILCHHLLCLCALWNQKYSSWSVGCDGVADMDSAILVGDVNSGSH